MEQLKNHQAHTADVSAGVNVISRAQASILTRQACAETARMARDANDLWITADSMRLSINRRTIKSQATPEAFREAIEWDMHDLWYIYYQASMHTSAQSPAQDRLVLQIIQLKEWGMLARSNQENEEATSDGRIWTDLPFLVQDMTHYWVSEFPQMSAAQRVNFSHFLAKLASIGLANDKISGIGLIVMRDTLETNLLTGTLGDQSDENSQRCKKDLSLAALLPCANAWLFTVGERFIKLAEKGWNEYSASVGECGELLRNERPDEELPLGFSSRRWMYWLRRLNRIATTSSECGETGISTLAKRMLDTMLMQADTENSLRGAIEEARTQGLLQYQPLIRQL